MKAIKSSACHESGTEFGGIEKSFYLAGIIITRITAAGDSGKFMDNPS